MTTEPIPQQVRRGRGAGAAPAGVERGPAGAALGSDPLVMSVAEAARALGVSDDLLYALIARGELPCVRFGRRRLIPRRVVERLIEAATMDFDASSVWSSVATVDRGAAAPLETGEHEEVDDVEGAIAIVDVASIPLHMGAPTSSSTASVRSSVRRTRGSRPR